MLSSHLPGPCKNTKGRSGSTKCEGSEYTEAPTRPVRTIVAELKLHAPFGAVGALTGLVIMMLLSVSAVPPSVSASLFWGLHPLHVLFSALVTAGMYRLYGKRGIWVTILIGYFGSVGIATVSDCVIPYVAESLLSLPNRGIHLGFIERWWLVNPLAFAGIGLAVYRPATRIPHAAHVLLSTWASLFHMTMAMSGVVQWTTALPVCGFLFVSVWIPCCTSDIVFPLLFVKDPELGGSV